jgi:predicted RNase H-like HicB family nuclease
VATNNRHPAWNDAYRIEMWLEIDDEGDAAWVAIHPELPGCQTQGDTPEEAVTMLREARELYLQGFENPPPPLVRDYRQDPTKGAWVPLSPSLLPPEPSIA